METTDLSTDAQGKIGTSPCGEISHFANLFPSILTKKWGKAQSVKNGQIPRFKGRTFPYKGYPHSTKVGKFSLGKSNEDIYWFTKSMILICFVYNFIL